MSFSLSKDSGSCFVNCCFPCCIKCPYIIRASGNVAYINSGGPRRCSKSIIIPNRKRTLISNSPTNNIYKIITIVIVINSGGYIYTKCSRINGIRIRNTRGIHHKPCSENIVVRPTRITSTRNVIARQRIVYGIKGLSTRSSISHSRPNRCPIIM